MLPKYSARLNWSASRNSLTLATERHRLEGKPILDLTQSNPTAAGIRFPGIHTALADPRVLQYEPSAAGIWSAREAVSAYYGGAVAPDRILLTASTSEAYAYLFKLLCDPGDEILVPRPSYPLFEMLAQMECARVRHYSLRYHDGWFVDLDYLREAVTDRTRAIIWVNPNNPTGSYLKVSEYERMAELCSCHRLALISDEVFADYNLEHDCQNLGTLTGTHDCLCFSLSGLSKVSGLPQMKLGWIVGSGPGHEHALQRLEWIADTFLSVGAPVQWAAGALLDARHDVQRQIKQRTARNLELLRSSMAGSACRVLRAEAGWYATLQAPRIRSEEAWTLELLNRGVLVQPGFFFDFESEVFLVISLLTEPEVFREALRHILDAC
jgi:alanine-synthesizing transaminase